MGGLDTRQVISFRVQERRLEAFRDGLFDARTGSAWELLAPEVEASGRHLTDAEFVGYEAESLNEATLRSVEAHLRDCPACAAESVRLREALAFWEDPRAVRRLEKRVRAAKTSARLAAFRQAFAPRRRGLGPLYLQGAFGEACAEEFVSLPFRVHEQGWIVEELHGMLERHGRDVYLRIQVKPAEERARFQDRRVLISIENPHEARPLLRRRIDVGVAVLLGTDLRLTESSQLEAVLLPDPGE